MCTLRIMASNKKAVLAGGDMSIPAEAHTQETESFMFCSSSTQGVHYYPHVWNMEHGTKLGDGKSFKNPSPYVVLHQALQIYAEICYLEFLYSTSTSQYTSTALYFESVVSQ